MPVREAGQGTLTEGASPGTMWLIRGPSLKTRTDSSLEEGWAERELRLPTERKEQTLKRRRCGPAEGKEVARVKALMAGNKEGLV